MSETALLVIDVQTGFIEGQFAVYQAAEMLDRVTGLIARARAAEVPVIFVRHDSDPENDGPLHPHLAPQPGESIIPKMTPDSFYQTDLKQQLDGLGIKHLIVAGFQTEMCIDTTCRHARSLDYKVTLVSDAHSTPHFDTAALTPEQMIAHHNQVLSNFAELKTSDAVDFA